MSTYTRILKHVWKDVNDTRGNAPTLLDPISSHEMKNRRQNLYKINKFNSLGRSQILVVSNELDMTIKYYFVSATYERVLLDTNDPVSMTIFMMALKKMYQLSGYDEAKAYYHQLMDKPYKSSKRTINKIVLGLREDIAKLL